MGLIALISVMVVGSAAAGVPTPSVPPPWATSSKPPTRAKIEALQNQLDTTAANDPGRPDALFALGWALRQSGDDRGARAAYMELIRDHPRSRWVPVIYADFGDFFFAAQSMKKARQFYERVLKFPGSQAYNYARYKLGWVAIELDEHPKALEIFFKLHRRARGKARLARATRAALVLAYAPVGKPSRAFLFFRRVHRPSADLMQRHLGDIYMIRGQHAAAIATYRELIARHPRDRQLCQWQAQIARAARLGQSGNVAARELRRLRELGRKLGRPGVDGWPTRSPVGRDGSST